MQFNNFPPWFAFTQLIELNVTQKESRLWAKLLESKHMHVKKCQKALNQNHWQLAVKNSFNNHNILCHVDLDQSYGHKPRKRQETFTLHCVKCEFKQTKISAAFS